MKNLPLHSIRTIVAIALMLFGSIIPQAAPPSPNRGSVRAEGQDNFFRMERLTNPPGNAKLDSALDQFNATYIKDGPEGALSYAQQHNIQLDGENVRVVVDAVPRKAAEVASTIQDLGATIEASFEESFKTGVPMSKLAEIADLPQVQYVRQPIQFQPEAELSRPELLSFGNGVEMLSPDVVSEGVSKIDADTWQIAGIRGQGMKVAIIDSGFAGYQSLLGTELPSTVQAVSFRVPPDITGGGDPHGTAVAEIIHDIAPDAQLLLVNIADDVDWRRAVNFVVSQEPDIISTSGGFFFGPLNGSGDLATRVTAARNAGIFWAQSAGNSAMEHWEGDFNDPDGDFFLDFAPGANVNRLINPANPGGIIQPGERIRAFLSWDLPDQDYGLLLVQRISGVWTPVAASNQPQPGPGGANEAIGYTTPTGGEFGIVIGNVAATKDVRFELFTPDHEPDFQVAASSIINPADSPGAITVGATNVNNDQLENFSSRGPTTDGRIKPDLAAPDRVTTVTFGREAFGGTSAAAPHVAGAAALVKSVNRSFSPSQIQEFLEANAVHLGTPSKNNDYGSGRLNLPPPATGAPGAPTPPPAAPPAPTNAVDAKIEIVFPHDAAGNPTSVTGGTLVNIGAFLFQHGSFNPVPCNFGQTIRLFRALNTGVAEQVATGTPSIITTGGKQITMWQFTNVDVSAVTNPLNKYYFFLDVDGVTTNTNVWSHGADARTIFPIQDVPQLGTRPNQAIDAKIEAVFPHDAAGNPKSVTEADFANLAVNLFAHGTLIAVMPPTNVTVRLFRSLNNGPEEFVAMGERQEVPIGGITFSRWVFNNIDVSAAKTPLNKYYFRAEVDGAETFPNIWSHGADARTIFPVQDVPASGCQ